MNLVTMETSMASGIAATYGYSVAGGVPGGLLAEYVMSRMGKATVAELSPILGARVAKAGVSFALFMVMGSFMEFAASARRRPPRSPRPKAAHMGIRCARRAIGCLGPASASRRSATSSSIYVYVHGHGHVH